MYEPLDLDAEPEYFHAVDPDSERIAGLRSLTLNYERRLNRLKEERSLLEKITQAQLQLVEKLGINEYNIEEAGKTQEKPATSVQDDEAGFYNGIHVGASLPSVSKGNVDSFFLQCPIVRAAFFDGSASVGVGKLGEVSANLPFESRALVFREVFSAVNSIPSYLKVVLALFECDSVEMMSETVENLAPKVFGFKRVLLYEYDAESKSLVITKQKLKMSSTLRLGLVCEAVKSGKTVFVKREDTDITQEDIALLNVSDSGYFVPVQNSNLVLAVFDKVDREFAPVDDLMVIEFAGFISEAFKTVSAKAKGQARIGSFQKICQVLLSLCEVSDMNHFVELLGRLLQKTFVCEYGQLFKVAGDVFSRVFAQDKEFGVGTGIVGRAIAKKETITVPRPELSLFFDSETDRPSSNKKCTSIAVCPAMEEKQVKWAVALYNKAGTFSDEDIAALEILCHFLSPVIKGIGKMNKDTSAMIEANQHAEDLSQLFSSLPHLNGLGNFDGIASQFARKMKLSLELEHTKLFIVDQKRKFLFRDGLQGALTRRSKNPLIATILLRQMRMQGSTIYFPILGADGKVVAISTHDLGSSTGMSNYTADNEDDSELVEVSNERIKKLLGLWGENIGRWVESASKNEFTDLCIIAEQRAMDSLIVISPLCAAEIWQSLDVYLFGTDLNNGDLKVLPSIKCGEDLPRTFNTLIYSLTRFAGDCNLLDFRVDRTPEKERCPASTAQAFPLTNKFDASPCDEPDVSQCLLAAMETLNIATFLSLDERQMNDMIVLIRKLHNEHRFLNWKLAVDRIQYLQYFLAKSGAGTKLSDVENAALFFYLICLNCQLDDPSAAERARRSLEGFNGCHIMATIFVVISSSRENGFFTLPPETQTLFWETVQKFERLERVEGLMSTDLATMIAAVCSFSYLSRPDDITAKYVKDWFDVELANEPQQTRIGLVHAQLEFEVRLILLTAFDALSEQGLKVEILRRQICDNVTKITNIDF